MNSNNTTLVRKHRLYIQNTHTLSGGNTYMVNCLARIQLAFYHSPLTASPALYILTHLSVDFSKHSRAWEQFQTAATSKREGRKTSLAVFFFVVVFFPTVILVWGVRWIAFNPILLTILKAQYCKIHKGWKWVLYNNFPIGSDSPLRLCPQKEGQRCQYRQRKKTKTKTGPWAASFGHRSQETKPFIWSNDP